LQFQVKISNLKELPNHIILLLPVGNPDCKVYVSIEKCMCYKVNWLITSA